MNSQVDSSVHAPDSTGGIAGEVAFPLDSGVVVKLPHHHHTNSYHHVAFKEPLLRAIANHLIVNGVVPRNSGIIDLGSWIGDNALPWAMSRPGVVYAIDPSEENIDFIRGMIALNNVKNIVTIQSAISDGQELLGASGDPSHCCFYAVDENSDNSNLSLVTSSTSLDSLHQEGVIGEVGFMHLDVEGYEMKVLLGARQMIEKYKPVVMFESHVLSQPTAPMINFLADRGYRVYMINESHPGANPDCRNFVAFHGDNNRISSIVRSIFEAINPVEVHWYHPAYESLQSLIPAELFLVGESGAFLSSPIFA
jgi:FkbM family methyltransferase